MLDLNFVRDNLELVKQKMRERGLADVLGDFESLDRERRRLLMEVEGRKARRNKVSDEIASLKKQKQDASALIAEMKPLSNEIQELDEQAKACDERLREVLRLVPNVPHASVPVGQQLRRQPGSPPLGPAAPVRFRTPGALGSGPGAGNSGFRTRHQDYRRAFCRVRREWAPSWSGRSPTSCSICTPASMATRKFCRRSW